MIVTIVVDYEIRPDGSEHLVLRGVFREGMEPPELNPAADVRIRNAVQIMVDNQYDMDMFEIKPAV